MHMDNVSRINDNKTLQKKCRNYMGTPGNPGMLQVHFPSVTSQALSKDPSRLH